MLSIFILFLISQNIFPTNIIKSIAIHNNRITIVAADDMPFVKDAFYVNYDTTLDVSTLPYTVATAPFIMNVAPLVWLSDNTYEIDAMDEDLFYALEKIKRVFQLFYPEAAWSGTLTPHQLVKTPRAYDAEHARTAVLFSHGLDAIYTSMRNADQDQLLITIWGSDVMPTKQVLWRAVCQRCREYAQEHGYEHAWVKSNFAYFYDLHKIHTTCPAITNWFGQAMQALAYIGVAFPLAYRAGCSLFLIGSTRTQDHPYPYGTHPAIDNLIACAGIQARHDGDDVDRLEKIEGIRTLCAQQGIAKPFLRVCWGKNVQGGNCTQCEKCLRTIAELIAVGENPLEYGFAITAQEAPQKILGYLRTNRCNIPGFIWHWGCVTRKCQQRNSSFMPKAQQALEQFVNTGNTLNDYNTEGTKFYAALWQDAVLGNLTLEKLDNYAMLLKSIEVKKTNHPLPLDTPAQHHAPTHADHNDALLPTLAHAIGDRAGDPHSNVQRISPYLLAAQLKNHYRRGEQYHADQGRGRQSRAHHAP